MYLCFCKIVLYCYEIDFNVEKNLNEIVFMFKSMGINFFFFKFNCN